MSDVQVIHKLEDVRPGDIYLGPIGGAVGAGVRLAQILVDGGWRVGPLHVEHIGIVVEAARDYFGPLLQNRATGQVEQLSAEIHSHEIPRMEAKGFSYYRTGLLAAPRMVQAMPRGAEEIPLTYARHWTPAVAYARIPEDYPGQAADAAAIARLMVAEKVAYSFASYGALALWHWGLKAPRLTEWIGRRREPHVTVLRTGHEIDGSPIWYEKSIQLPVEAICSVLADQCWSLAGKRVMDGLAPQAVTPSQLGQRLLTGMDGVVWGWPMAHPHP
jgi:hypothetical protein